MAGCQVEVERRASSKQKAAARCHRSYSALSMVLMPAKGRHTMNSALHPLTLTRNTEGDANVNIC